LPNTEAHRGKPAALPLPAELRAEPLAFVRRSCAAVARSATLVKIDVEWLEAYAAGLPPSEVAQLEAPVLPRDANSEALCAFVFQLDAVNFGSGYFPRLAKRPGLSGYRSIEAALVDHFDEYGPLTARELGQMSARGCSKMFGQELDDPAIAELMQFYAESLRDLGRFTSQRFGGRFAEFAGAARGSAEALVRLLLELPYYRDLSLHDGNPVAFLKRAQITAADLSRALPGSLGKFRDLGRLTLFADNLVPHVLRIDGVLRFDDSLIQRIDRGELLQHGSREEVEIRACALHAVELLAERLGEASSAQQLDYWLWLRGSRPEYKSHPRHRSRCIFY
jgi:hypothetical protein